LAQEPGKEPTPEETIAAAQAALQEAQSAQHGLHAERQDLVAAYYDAVECADGNGMVDVRRRLFEVDEKVAAAGVAPERAGVELAQAKSRALVSLYGTGKGVGPLRAGALAGR
jgi:hypothetical protein